MYIVVEILLLVKPMPSNSLKPSLVPKRKPTINVKSEYYSASTKSRDDKQVLTALT